MITDEAPYGAFTLHNAGTEGVEVTVSARYGAIASTDSTTAVVLDEAGQLGDLARHLTFFRTGALFRQEVSRSYVIGFTQLQKAGILH